MPRWRIHVRGLGTIHGEGEPPQGEALRKAVESAWRARATPPPGAMPTPVGAPRPTPEMLSAGLARPEEPPPVAPSLGQRIGRALTPSHGQVRAVIVGAGEALGAAAGMALGRTPQTAAGGAILGAAGGSTVSDALGILPSETPITTPRALREVGAPPGTMEVATRAATEGALTASGFGLGNVLTTGRRRFARALIKPSQEMAELGKAYGVSTGIEDVSERTAFRKARKVFGIFPLLNRPFKEASIRRATELRGAMDRELDVVAKSVPGDTQPALGRAIHRKAKDSRTSFLSLVNRLSREIQDEASQSNATIAMERTRAVAGEVLDEIGDRALTRQVAKEGGGTATSRFQIAPDQARTAARFLATVGDEQGNLTAAQWRGLTNEINNAMDSAREGGRTGELRHLQQLAEAVEEDFIERLDGPPDLVAKVLNFKRTFHQGSLLYERPVGQQFGRLDKRIFKAGFEQSGNLYPDQFADHLFRQRAVTASAEGVRDLRGIVGDGVFRRAYRHHLDTVFDDAVQVATDPKTGRITGVIDIVGRYAEKLGLFRPRSGERAATAAALEGTGQTVENLESLFRLARAIAETEHVDVNQFIVRRAGLGGMRAIGTSLLPGVGQLGAKGATAGAAGLGLGKAAVLLLGLRRGSRWLTDPEATKRLMRAIDPTTPETVRRGIATNLVRRFAQPEDGETQGDLAARLGGAEGAALAAAAAAPTAAGIAFGGPKRRAAGLAGGGLAATSAGLPQNLGRAIGEEVAPLVVPEIVGAQHPFLQLSPEELDELRRRSPVP